jgi:hypothetical protein
MHRNAGDLGFNGRALRRDPRGRPFHTRDTNRNVGDWSFWSG